jgi:hypothetical protein
MTIDRLDPAQCVVMRCHGDHPEWNNTILSWDLVKSESDEGPTVLRFTHSGWREFTDYCIGCFDVGKIDVPPEGCCRRRWTRPTVEGITRRSFPGSSELTRRKNASPRSCITILTAQPPLAADLSCGPPGPNPHSKRAGTVSYVPFRPFRPLEVSRRRPPSVWECLSRPASRNLHLPSHFQARSEDASVPVYRSDAST